MHLIGTQGPALNKENDMTREELLLQDTKNYHAERTQTAVVSYPPRWVTIGIHSRCTNRCAFCSYHSPDARHGKSNVYGLHYTMGLEQFKWQVDFMYAGRVPHVHICAPGEPFLNNNIIAMIDYLADKYGDASFQSNFNAAVMKRGNYLEKIIQRKDKISYIVTDIHAGSEEAFNSIKKGSNFTTHKETLQLLSKHIKLIIGSCVVTRSNYQEVPKIIQTLIDSDISMQLNITNLFPHDFNEFSAIKNVYHTADTEITKTLEQAKALGEQHGLVVNIPQPYDSPSVTCNVFWDKIQIWPVAGIDPDRYAENLISHACNAVVLGDINTLGYLSDYDSVMDFWNNKYLVAIRRKILAGKYPDRYCQHCPDAAALRP